MTILSVLFAFAFHYVVLGNNFNQETVEPMASIVNGYDAPNRPFYVKLSISNTWLCGGTVISARYVLTAAHCVASEPSNDVLVYVGDFSKPGSYKHAIPAARTKVHEGYEDDGNLNFPNDIALIELSWPISNERVLPLCDRTYFLYTIGVCGMGKTDPSSETGATVLQEVQVKERDNCNKSWNGPEKQVCLGYSHKGSCLGDSGGPAFPMNRHSNPICLYGIVSYGSKQCDSNAIYTRASAYLDWIQKNTQ